jgi:FAD/FMN-containing dehydrogenase
MTTFTRRELLKTTAVLGAGTLLLPDAVEAWAAPAPGVEVNDIQSQLNLTRVRRIVKPRSLDAVQAALRDAHAEGRPVSVCNGRHAMGGQQFGTDMVLLDVNDLNRVVSFDREAGRVEVEAGIQWPDLMAYLEREQAGVAKPWAIRQKQTGIDTVGIGGSLGSNIHGRGLRFAPFIADVESFVLVDAAGRARTCSRTENAELFSLAIGGYGLFGVITHATLRLVPRSKVERVVKVIPVRDLLAEIAPRIEEGCLYGDCQFSTDLTGDGATHPGVLSCYRPIPMEAEIPPGQKRLSKDQWLDLYLLARTDKLKAFGVYSSYYLSTNGQRYWSDTHQNAGSFQRGTEMITEVYVRSDAFVPFMTTARKDFVEHRVDPTYGTIRFIEKDAESFLPWAKERYVCIVCNLHVVHTRKGKSKAKEDFRRIIDRAIEHGGSYYLTYHRFATRRQVQACFPQLPEFLRLKKKYDPQERFQSDWYRHHKEMFDV